MSFEEILKQKATQTNFLGLDIVNRLNSIKGKVNGKPEFKNDAKENECLYVTIETKDGMVTQKYTKTLYKILTDAVEKAGGWKFLQENMVEWVKMDSGNSKSFPRFYPTPKKA